MSCQKSSDNSLSFFLSNNKNSNIMKKILFIIIAIIVSVYTNNVFAQDDLSIEYPLYPNIKDNIIINKKQCEIYYKDTLKNGNIINYVCLNNLFDNEIPENCILFIKGTDDELKLLEETIFPYIEYSISNRIISRENDFPVYNTSSNYFNRYSHIVLLATSNEEYIVLDVSYNENRYKNKTKELSIREAHLGYTLHNERFK